MTAITIPLYFIVISCKQIIKNDILNQSNEATVGRKGFTMATYNQEQTQLRFDPNNLPSKPMPVSDIHGRQIGTFNPYTNVIHPTSDSPYGALKLLGSMAFNLEGKLVGNFNAEGLFRPIE